MYYIVQREFVADNDKIRHVYGLTCNDHITEHREHICGLTAESSCQAAASYSHFLAFVGTSRYPNVIRINFHSHTAFDNRALSYSALISNTFNGSIKIQDLSIRLI